MLNHRFNHLNRRIRHISNEIIENDNAELPLMRRNAVELLSCLTPFTAAVLMEKHNVLPMDVSLIIAVPVAALAAVSYVRTLIKRNPYQDYGIELGKMLQRECRSLRKEFPKARWVPKEGCYMLPEPRPQTQPIATRLMAKAQAAMSLLL